MEQQNIDIIDLDISIRSYRSLNSINITHLNQLSDYTQKELMLSGFSKKSIEEINLQMIKYNIKWRS